MGVGQMVIFSQPRGDRGAIMHGGRCGTDFLESDCHNYFISLKKKLCQLNQNNRTLLGPYSRLPTTGNQLKVLDCQGLETFCSLITPGVITFPARLSMSSKCLLTPLENTGLNLMLPSKSLL